MPCGGFFISPVSQVLARASELHFSGEYLHKHDMKKSGSSDRKISTADAADLLEILKIRFSKHMNRHEGIAWADVEAKLKSSPAELWSLSEMERSGGEPDVVGFDNEATQYIIFDCSAESPKERRSVCYDQEGLESRKEHRPANNAIDMAAAMGIELLNEEQYRQLQELGSFDCKTSSWVKTPDAIRNLGGALFGDRRYNQTFIYHNGAQSYYAARGFRGVLRI